MTPRTCHLKTQYTYGRAQLRDLWKLCETLETELNQTEDMLKAERTMYEDAQKERDQLRELVRKYINMPETRELTKCNPSFKP